LDLKDVGGGERGNPSQVGGPMAEGRGLFPVKEHFSQGGNGGASLMHGKKIE